MKVTTNYTLGSFAFDLRKSLAPRNIYGCAAAIVQLRLPRERSAAFKAAIHRLLPPRIWA